MFGVGGDVGYGGCEPRIDGIVQCHGRLSRSAQHRVVYRKMCWRFPAVLQEIRK